MPNHVRLVLMPSTVDGLGRAVGQAHRRAGLVNARARWSGHLFQGRYACVAMDEAHLIRCGPWGTTCPSAEREISRFPYKERPHMPGSPTTPDRPGTRAVAPVRVAFRCVNGVGVRDMPFAAQWLAYALPYRRFVPALADSNARLGADVDRYSFIAVDFHHLLLAGLPAL